MRYPKNLNKGDYIGTTAPSAGIIKPVDQKRLDNVKNNFEKLGYKYIETQNVRTDFNGKSSSGKERAEQLLELWKNPEVGAIISAAGGDFLNEMLDQLDIEELKKLPPKWFQGYSNNTELTMILNTVCDTACIYGPTIKDFGMRKLHKVLEDSIEIMTGKKITQKSFEKHESLDWSDRVDPYEEYKLVNKTKWKNLNNEEEISFTGRSIGGCFDEVINLIGTKYDHVKEYIEKYKNDGIVWFLEIFEKSTPQVYINLWQMKNAGYFDYCKGIIFGRSLMLREDYELTIDQVIKDAIGDLNIPVIYDADIGHLSPQMPIVSGAILEIKSKSGKGSIKNYIK